jgi:glucokinase
MEHKNKSINISVVGVDVGGTKISAGLVKNNQLTKQASIPTPKNATEKEVVAAIIRSIQQVSEGEISAIGVGVPGLVNVKQGVVYDVQNISSFKDVKLKAQLETVFQVPVYVGNDANCFVLGAKYFDKGRPYNNFVGLTLGTGLGGGVIVNGLLHEGVGSGAGEFGHIPYLDGVLENYCSGQLFHRNNYDDGLAAALLAENGDPKALALFGEFANHLGEAIKIAAHILSPEAVILGGSVSNSFHLFEASMWESIRRFPYRNVVDNLVVETVNDPHLAVKGAASLAYQKLSV